MEGASSSAPYWDPYDAAIDDDPHPVWRRLRDEEPVYRNDRYDFWALSRFEDIDAAHRDPATFSSARGTVLERMTGEIDKSGMMIFMDPPEHTQLRRVVSRAFSPRRLTLIEDRVRALCADLLDPQRGASGFDYVADFAAQLPSRVISSLVGVPPEDQEEQRRRVDGMFHIEPEAGMANDRSIASALALIEYLTDLVRLRTAEPQDDLVSDLVRADVGSEGSEVRHLSTSEATEFALLLYTAGTETVAKLLGNAAVILAAYPEQRRQLLEDPSLIPNAVEELLRYEPPSPVNGRWTTQEVSLHGTTVPEGSRVLLLTGSAGRDDRVFPNADTFDVRRQFGHHLSFGYGVHFCIGAALARLEGRVAIEETLRRFPEWEIDGSGLRRVHTSTVRGYDRVPVIL